MSDLLGALFLLAGALFLFIGAIGLLRLPDLYTRLSASTKGATLGVSCAMLAAAFHFGEEGVTSQAFLVLLFVLLTSPVSSHLIGRSAYYFKVPLWKNSVTDELKDRYHPDTHELESVDDAELEHNPKEQS